MRFLKVYLTTMIIIFILIAFIYAMSFVYTQSLEVSLGTTIPITEVIKDDSKTAFVVLGNKITVDNDFISEAANKASDYLPSEVKCVLAAFDKLESFYNNAYNSKNSRQQ